MIREPRTPTKTTKGGTRVLPIPPKGKRPTLELLLADAGAFDRALTWYFTENQHMIVEFASGSRLYRFYYFRSERRQGPRFVACKIVKTPRVPALDKYAASVARRRACRECGLPFEKRGRREFCSGRCGARSRKRKFLGQPEPKRKDPRRKWRDQPTEAQIWRAHASAEHDNNRTDWRA